MTTIAIGATTLTIGADEDGRFVCTTLPDGATVMARPQPWSESTWAEVLVHDVETAGLL